MAAVVFERFITALRESGRVAIRCRYIVGSLFKSLAMYVKG